MNRQIDRKIENQTVRQIDREIERLIGRQIYRSKDTYKDTKMKQTDRSMGKTDEIDELKRSA